MNRLIAILTGLVLLSNTAISSYAAQSSPTAVNLHLGDLPTGFTLDTDEMLTNAQAAKGDQLTPAQETQRGRLLSNHESFTGSNIVGLLNVDSTVVLYTSPVTARAAYDRSMKHGVKGPLKRMSLDSVGDKSSGWVYTVKQKDISGTGYVAAFVRGRYLMLIITSGMTGTFSADSVSKFAKIVDQRIQKNG